MFPRRRSVSTATITAAIKISVAALLLCILIFRGDDPSAARILIAVLGLASLSAVAQTRLSDKDVQQLMSNLHNDVKAFRSPFKSALSKSPIHKTSQEQSA